MSEPQINTKDVVLEVSRKVDKLIEDMADVKVIAATVGTTVEALHDHELRIRVLEQAHSERAGERSIGRYLWAAAAAVLSAAWWVPDFIHRFTH